MKYSAWFFISVGLLMVAQWGFFLSVGAVSELQSEPIRISLHLLGEFVTAIFLIVSGIALRQKKAWAKPAALFAAGMLTYTVIVSPGYFAQQGQWPLVGMFALLLVLNGVQHFVFAKNQRRIAIALANFFGSS